MGNLLRSVVFLGRNVAADILTGVAQRLRPRDDRPEWLTQVARDIAAEAVGKRPGDVTLSAVAEGMIAIGDPPEPEDEHAPPPPLKGSLAYRQRQGVRR